MRSRTKKWLGGFLLLFLLTLMSPCVIGWKMRNVVDSMKMEAPSGKVFFYQDLNLSDSQKEKIQALEKEFQKQTVGFCEHHCTAKMKLGELLASGKADPAALFRLQKEISNAYAASEEATLKHVMQVCEVLTPEQKARFQKKYGDYIQESCPMEFVH